MIDLIGLLIASLPIIVAIVFVAWILSKFPPPIVGRRFE